jgi:hypothetical protein
MALLVTGYGFSQVDSIAISLPIISNLGLEKGVEQTDPFVGRNLEKNSIQTHPPHQGIIV